MTPTADGLDTRSAGARYEDIALAHLQRTGLVLVARNFNCRHGELDLVMDDRGTLVFVEVRYRRGSAARTNFGDGLDSVSASKRAKLIRAASMFLAAQPRLAQRTCRFDVVAIAGDVAAPTLDWCKNAFESN
ncbi:MAG: YraN family protein [Dokdonella sp.]|uniref:YraN family protein n=1 Tax=Dokdonella sp. TaxID=2291710 RepID=UPI0032640D6B